MYKVLLIIILFTINANESFPQLAKEQAINAFTFLSSHRKFNKEINYDKAFIFLENGINYFKQQEKKAIYELMATTALLCARNMNGNKKYYDSSIEYFKRFYSLSYDSDEKKALNIFIANIKNESDIYPKWISCKENLDIIDYDILADAAINCKYVYKLIIESKYEKIKYEDFIKYPHIDKAKSYLKHFPNGEYAFLMNGYIKSYNNSIENNCFPIPNAPDIKINCIKTDDDHACQFFYENEFIEASSIFNKLKYTWIYGSLKKDLKHATFNQLNKEDFFRCKYLNGSINRNSDNYILKDYSRSLENANVIDFFFSEGMMWTYMTAGISFHTALVDLSGNIITRISQTSAEPFINNYSCIDNSGIMNKKGKWLIKPNKYFKIHNFSDGITAGNNKKGEWVLIDTLGIEQATINNPSIKDISYFHEGMAVFTDGKKFGFINSFGKIVIPAAYDVVTDFKFEHSIVSINGKYGIVDMNGNVTVPIEYDEISEEKNSNHIYMGEKNNQRFYISANNNFIIKDTVNTTISDSKAIGNYIIQDWNLYNLIGNPMLPPDLFLYTFSKTLDGYTSYTYSTISDDFFIVADNERRGLGIISIREGIIIPCIYQTIYQLSPDKTFFSVSTCRNSYIYNTNQRKIVCRDMKIEPNITEDSYYENRRICRYRSEYGEKAFILNEYGERVGKYIFDKLWNFNKNIALFKMGMLYGFVDINGDIIYTTSSPWNLLPLRAQILLNKH